MGEEIKYIDENKREVIKTKEERLKKVKEEINQKCQEKINLENDLEYLKGVISKEIYDEKKESLKESFKIC